MGDVRWRKPGGRELGDPFPRRVILLSTPPQRTQPEFADVAEERSDRAARRRHCKVVVVAGGDLLQPFSLRKGSADACIVAAPKRR